MANLDKSAGDENKRTVALETVQDHDHSVMLLRENARTSASRELIGLDREHILISTRATTHDEPLLIAMRALTAGPRNVIAAALAHATRHQRTSLVLNLPVKAGLALDGETHERTPRPHCASM